jgi:CubicO group peptidase (beta-lactamase class C family)
VNRLIALVCLLVLALSSFAQAPAQPALGADLDQFIERTMKDWKVPGMAVTVVKDGQVILSKGYGLRDVKNNKPATDHTLFAIGSATKSFTVATLGSLVGQGKVEWDKPVRDYMPEFRLYDEAATDRMTPRDLVTHRSGLPRHDTMWYNVEMPRADVVSRLRYLEPSKDLRSYFQYNNLMFLTAGYLTEKLTGHTWEQSVKTLIFDPLGMTGSNFSVSASQKMPDFALPYEKDDKEVVHEIPFRTIDTAGPAGSINSSVADMIKYVQMHLAKGQYDGKQVIAASDVEQMQTPQMVINTPIIFPELGHAQYGMGLFITAYRGHKLVNHGGNIDGFSALVSFLPQDNIGLVVLTNLNGTPYPSILERNIYDRLLGLSQVDWNDRLLKRVAAGKAAEEEAKKKGYTPRVPNTHPSHPLADYAGDYNNPAYGTIRLEPQGDDFRISYHGFTSTLKHFHYDVFQVPENALDRLERTKVAFHTNWNGEIDSLSSPLEPDVQDIVFRRVADAGMSERSFLEKFAGQYQLGPNTIVFALRGEHTLTLTIPGQPTRELEPVRGTRFNLKGLSGYAVEFKQAGGAVTEVVFLQPESTVVAKRK